MEAQYEKLMSLHVELGDVKHVGHVPEGLLNIIPITGGTFEGKRLRGKICPGGADWNVAVSPCETHLLARYWLQTDDGAIIAVENEGIWNAKRDGGTIHTTPRFMCDRDGEYAFLSSGCHIGMLTGGDEGSVDIDMWTLVP